MASSPVSPVTSTAGYHWQARVRDSSGAVNDTTAWVAYGLNPEANIDFARDAAANTTAAPGALLQFEADGTTALATGATAGSRTAMVVPTARPAAPKAAASAFPLNRVSTLTAR